MVHPLNEPFTSTFSWENYAITAKDLIVALYGYNRSLVIAGAFQSGRPDGSSKSSHYSLYVIVLCIVNSCSNSSHKAWHQIGLRRIICIDCSVTIATTHVYYPGRRWIWLAGGSWNWRECAEWRKTWNYSLQRLFVTAGPQKLGLVV